MRSPSRTGVPGGRIRALRFLEFIGQSVAIKVAATLLAQVVKPEQLPRVLQTVAVAVNLTGRCGAP